MLLASCVGLTRIFFVQVGGGERADDSHIDGQTTTVTPKLKGDITRAALALVGRTQ
jgi:hypothetical protein